MTLTFVVLGVTIALFIWGKIPADLVALLCVLALFVGGVIEVRQALAGFGEPAVVMIAALFVVGEGISASGLTAWLSGRVIAIAQGSKTRLLILVMTGTALLSAFLSNTGTVATLLPAVVAAAWSMGQSPSRYLIPLAFAANAGGLLTLTGTPPNIIASSALEQAGFEPFGFFEFGLIGLPLLLTTIAFMAVFGHRFLPDRTSEEATGPAPTLKDLAGAYGLRSDLFRLRVAPGAPIATKTLAEVQLGRKHGIAVLEIQRAQASDADGVTAPVLEEETRLLVGDVLVVRMSSETLQSAAENLGLERQRWTPDDEDVADVLLGDAMGIAELIIVPRSDYVGREVREGTFSEQHGVQLLAIRRRDKALERDAVRLEVGDSLLVRGPWAKIERLGRDPRTFAVLGNPEAIRRARLGPRASLAALILVGMVAAMVLSLVPASMAALTAAVAMVVTGCANRRDAYRSVSWSSVVLIAAMIPMSTALQVTGGAQLVATALVDTLGQIHPLALMAGVFLLTTTLSQVINNTATAVLVAPIVMQAATDMQLSARPLLLVVAVAASTAFLTPVGTSTNLLVYAPGGYRFTDYIRVGGPLSLTFLVVTVLLVPLIWPF